MDEKKEEKRDAKPAAQPQQKQPDQRQSERPDQKQPEQKRASITFSAAVPAKVEEVIGRTGMRGEAIQVRCKVLEGRDSNKILRRNVLGPVQKDDVLMLRETEFEARQLKKAGRGTH